MKILSISNMDIWPFGKNKGIPSISASQTGFAALGHEVYFLCPLKRKGLLAEEEMDGVNIKRYRLPFGISSLSVYNLPLNNFWTRVKGSIIYNLEWFFVQVYALFKGIALARKIKPDIIYAHSTTAALPAYLVSRFCKAKFVIRVYGIKDMSTFNFWGRIRAFRDIAVFKLPADYFIVTNDGTGGCALLKDLGVKEEKIKNWRNGIDVSISEPVSDAKNKVCEQLKIPESSRIILSLSRFISIYGVDDLVSSLPELFKKQDDIVCVIAGSGPDKTKLETIVNKAGIASRVFFVGTVEREEVKKLLYASDIYVFLPQLHNCTNTMWEAMSCGVCILTTETESIKEILTSGENGVLISPDKVKDLPQVLDDLFGDKDLMKRLGENVLNRSREVLESWPDRIKKEAKLLEELVKG
ncbi:MAG: glycosyltransferase family 4 protein [PVC group bacterium]|nr:glycosyltransferase family 4 protein [PVC group bacterium]